MIYCYVMSGDGLEGSWFFETLPRLGEDVQFKGYGCYRIARVIHWPTNNDMEELDVRPRREGVGLYVTLVSRTFGYTPPAAAFRSTEADSWDLPREFGPLSGTVLEPAEPGFPFLAAIFQNGKVIFQQQAESREAGQAMLDPVLKMFDKP